MWIKRVGIKQKRESWHVMGVIFIYFYFVNLKNYFKISLIYLAALGLSCSMQGLVLSPRVEPGPSVLGAQSLSHWTTKEVPE